MDAASDTVLDVLEMKTMWLIAILRDALVGGILAGIGASLVSLIDLEGSSITAPRWILLTVCFIPSGIGISLVVGEKLHKGILHRVSVGMIGGALFGALLPQGLGFWGLYVAPVALAISIGFGLQESMRKRIQMSLGGIIGAGCGFLCGIFLSAGWYVMVSEDSDLIPSILIFGSICYCLTIGMLVPLGLPQVKSPKN